jgi:hypothetical protein
MGLVAKLPVGARKGSSGEFRRYRMRRGVRQ